MDEVTDQKLRRLERRWRSTGNVEDEAAYLRERVRQGDLSERHLRIAAYLGVPGATLALDEDERPCMSDMKEMRELRSRLYALIPEADPTPLSGAQIRAVSDGDPKIKSRLLLLLTVVGVGDYGAGVTLELPSPASGHGDLRFLGHTGRGRLVYDPKGNIRRLDAAGPVLLAYHALDWLKRHLRGSDPAEVPWHVANVPRRSREDPAAWSARTRAWCEQISDDDYSLRTHLQCSHCRFSFIYRTTNYSMSSSSDVQNWAICAEPDCRHQWTEWS